MLLHNALKNMFSLSSSNEIPLLSDTYSKYLHLMHPLCPDICPSWIYFTPLTAEARVFPLAFFHIFSGGRVKTEFCCQQWHGSPTLRQWASGATARSTATTRTATSTTMKVRAKPQQVHLSRTPQPELELAKRLRLHFHFAKEISDDTYQRNICLVTFPCSLFMNIYCDENLRIFRDIAD